MEKHNIPASLLTLVGGVCVTLVSLWFGIHNNLMPEQASAQAPLVDDFFNLMVTVGTSLFIVVEGAIIFALLRFRNKPSDESDAEPVTGNLPLEIFWTAIPTVIVIIVGIYSVEVYRDMGGFDFAGGAHNHGGASTEQVAMAEMSMSDMEHSVPEESLGFDYGFGAAPGRETVAPDVVINVTAMQFAWLFEYPKAGIMTGEMHVPLGQDVQVNLSAMDVIHSFWVPEFRLKQDVIPGKQSQVRFVATKPGHYSIVCAELCGSYHGGMRGDLVVDSPEDYQAWLAENQYAQVQQPTTIAAVPNVEQRTLSAYQDQLNVEAATLDALIPQQP
ncbi:MAG: cytochrome c oxidase subunit II [Cyanobacteria bacterium P01_H01_bin.15]